MYKSLAAVATSAVVLLLAPTTAQAESPLTDADFYAVVEAGARSGHYTPEQLEQLGTRKDLAAKTPDATRAKVVVKEATAPSIGARATAAANATRHVDRYVIVPGLLGIGNGFQFHLEVTWTYSGKKIISTPTHACHLSGATEYPGVRIRSCTKVSTWTRADHYSNATTVTGIWHQCLPDAGCFGGNGVEGKFGLYGNGDYTYVGKIKNV